MKTYKLNFNTNAFIGDTSVEKKESVFECSVNLLKLVSNLNEGLETSNESIDAGIDFIMECDNLFAQNISAILNADEEMLGTTSGLRRRLKSAVNSVKSLKEDLEYNTQTFLPLDEEQLVEVGDAFDRILGNLACYVFHQFDLSLYLVKDFEEVSDALDLYCRKNNLDYSELSVIAVECRSLMDAHAPNIGVLEKYPEFEKAFSELAGEDLYDCEFITLEVVKKLVSGEMTVPEFRDFVTESLEKED